MQKDSKIYSLVITKLEKHTTLSHLRGSYTLHLSFQKYGSELENIRFTKLVERDALGNVQIKYYAVSMTMKFCIFSQLRIYPNAKGLLKNYIKRCIRKHLLS